MSIPKEFITLLLAKVDIVDLIHTYIPLKKKSGSNYFAVCPFHQEKSGSFSVSQTKQFYYCFGCGAHGNVIDFLMQHERLNFPEAVELLAHQAGMTVPQTAAAAHKKDDVLPALYDLLQAVSTEYTQALRQTPRAIQYLKARGLTGQIAKHFALGYAPSGWRHVFDRFGKNEIEQKKLLETGLIIKKEDKSCYDRFRDRIMFPIHDYRGRIIGFGGRIIDQGEPKYLNSPETPLFQKGHELYGLYQAIKANHHLERILVVEGYMDVISLFQQGITYAVATLGTATTSHHLKRLMRYTSEIVFCFDGDAAGRTAALRALNVLMPHLQDDLQIRFLFLPDGEDPDTLIKREGKTAFEKRLSEALSVSAFFFQSLGNQSDLATMEGRARFAAAALQGIKQVPGKLLSEILLEELAKRARIDIAELKRQLNKSDPVTEETFIQPETLSEQAAALKPAIQFALTLLIQHPELAQHITKPLPPPVLPGLSFLQRLISLIQQTPQMTAAALREHWRGQKESQFIASLTMTTHEIPPQGLEQEFLGTLRQIELLCIEEEINTLLAKAANKGLSDAEKKQLSLKIKQKKGLSHIISAPSAANP